MLRLCDGYREALVREQAARADIEAQMIAMSDIIDFLYPAGKCVHVARFHCISNACDVVPDDKLSRLYALLERLVSSTNTCRVSVKLLTPLAMST